MEYKRTVHVDGKQKYDKRPNWTWYRDLEQLYYITTDRVQVLFFFALQTFAYYHTCSMITVNTRVFNEHLSTVVALIVQCGYH